MVRRCAGVSVPSANAFRCFRGKRYDSMGLRIEIHSHNTPHLTPSAMPPKPERSSDTPALGRIATATDESDAHQAISNSAFGRAPSYSPAELAGFRDFALVMRDAIGEKGSFNELQPAEAAARGCLGTLRSLHRRGRVTLDKDLCIAAAAGGQLKVLKWLLENGFPSDEATIEGETPLIIAAEKGHIAVVRVLIQAGANINKTDDTGMTPVSIAAHNGHEAVVRALIQTGADVNKAKHDGATPLYTAAQKGHESVVRVLIVADSNINKATDTGATPLYIAAQDGLEAIVRALIEAGADVNKTDDGETPLYVAAEFGHEPVVRALIEAGADVNKVTDEGATPLSISMKPFVDVDRGNHAAIVQILRNAGAV
jgi:ankyrin repeat protein